MAGSEEIMIRKGETRAVIKPEKIRNILKKRGKRMIERSSGVDTYFDMALFRKNCHFRVRRQTFSYPKKEVRMFIHLKPHKPNFRRMNVYSTFALKIDDDKEAVSLLKAAGYRQTFVEKWVSNELYELNGLKIELCRIIGWGWIVEIEGRIKTTKEALYRKVLETAEMLGLEEKDLTNIEPAYYLFKKKYG